MTTPEGQPESIGHGWIPDEVEWEPVVDEQPPLTPVFDEVTRERTAEIIARYPQSRSALLPLLRLRTVRILRVGGGLEKDLVRKQEQITKKEGKKEGIKEKRVGAPLFRTVDFRRKRWRTAREAQDLSALAAVAALPDCPNLEDLW